MHGLRLILFAGWLFSHACTSWAHAMMVKAIPAAGAHLDQAPAMLKIQFDSILEPVFSHIRVLDMQLHRVDRIPQMLDQTKRRLMAPLKPLTAGRYHVFWSVVSRDGHRTQGDYYFYIENTDSHP